MADIKKAWYIECCTGCSCCASDNFDWGFYDNPEDPQKLIDRWRQGDGNPLCSQYAPYGRYYLNEVEVEVLPDGRWIVDGSTVFTVDEVEDFPGVIYWPQY